MMFLISSAFAAQVDVGFDVMGATHHDGPLLERQRVHAPGLRVGVDLTPRYSGVLTWHHSRIVDTHELPDDSQLELRRGYDQWDVGVRADLYRFWRLEPYVLAQGSLLWSRTRLDDDVDDAFGVPVKSSALDFGGLAVGGFDFVLVERALDVRTGIEFGYGWMSSIEHAEVGDVDQKGLLIRGGVRVGF